MKQAKKNSERNLSEQKDIIIFTEKQQAIVDYFTRNFAKHPQSFNSFIHKNCQMFSFGSKNVEKSTGYMANYFAAGQQMLYPLKEIIKWKFKKFSNISNFLDFASGFGRLTRFLVQELDTTKIWISDIQSEAVAFQKEQFDVNGFVSTIDPTQLHCKEQFDCIFVASLFTHLPEQRFHEWLKQLFQILTPDGILIFTVHDHSNAPLLELSESGIHFNPNASEIKTLDSGEYGSAHVTENFVANAIAKATGGIGNYFRFPKGLWHHDIYLVSKTPYLNRPDIGIISQQMQFTLANNQITGFALESRCGHKIHEIQTLYEGKVTQTFNPGKANSDIVMFYGDQFLQSGWSFPLMFVISNLKDSFYSDDLVLKMRSTCGNERLFPVWIAETQDSGDSIFTGFKKRFSNLLHL